MINKLIMHTKNWQKFLCKRNELQLIGTLNGGQSFRWTKRLDDELKEDLWTGVFAGCVWQLIQQDDCILYKVYKREPDVPSTKKPKMTDDHESMLRSYFRLDLNLDEYYKQWSEADPYFKIASEKFYGIRILMQDPVENLFSFICSSNNNISRISGMIDKMCLMYGEKICDVDGCGYYSFPTVDALAQPGVEGKLRNAGFGYRAKYISKSAEMIMAMGGAAWFDKLKEMEYADAKAALMMLTGIGAKVADCICLMSLNHLEALPVDTHVYQIALKRYLKHLPERKTVTESIYNEIGDYFRKLYGPLAGWAHTVLFCADLKMFQNDGKKKKKSNKV